MRTRDPVLNEERRDAILEAATTCFVRHGFHASSMKDISAEAGMSPGTVYHYFASKADIVAGIVEREHGTTADLLGILDAHADILAGLAAVLDRIASAVTERDLILHTEVASELLRQEPLRQRARESEAAATMALAGRILAAQGAGQVAAAIESRGAAIAITAMIDGYLWRATLHGPRAAAADLPAMKEAVARVLGGSP